MDRTRNKFLSRSGLPGDQHGGVCGSNLRHKREYFLQGARTPDDLVAHRSLIDFFGRGDALVFESLFGLLWIRHHYRDASHELPPNLGTLHACLAFVYCTRVIGRRGRGGQADSEKHPTQQDEYSRRPAYDHAPLRLALLHHCPLRYFSRQGVARWLMRPQLAPRNYDSEVIRLSLDCDAAYIGGRCTCYSNWSMLASPAYLSCMQVLAAGVVVPRWRGATATVNRVDSHVSALAAETRDLIADYSCGAASSVCSE